MLEDQSLKQTLIISKVVTFVRAVKVTVIIRAASKKV